MTTTFTRRTRVATMAATTISAALLASACTTPPGPPDRTSTPHAWERAREVEPTKLVVSLWGAPPIKGPTDYCGAEYSARVRESPARVVITVHEHRNPPPPNVRVACTMIAAEREVPVKLAAPVGGRTLIDGVTGEERPLDRG